MGQDREGTFQGVGGVELYYRSWHPLMPPRAILVILHGLGGHSGLFGNIVNHLLPKGYALYALDWRGHGRSLGKRGHINNWGQFRADLDTFIALIQQQEGKCPCFILGHSLGAIVALDYAIRYRDKIQGVIAVASPLGKVGVSPLKLWIGKTLSSVCPRFTLNTGIALEVGSRDTKVLEMYATDPLRHNHATARLATEFFASVEWIQSHAAELKVPLLMLHGGADLISLPEGSRIFFDKVTFPDKEKREYPEAYHELHNEINYQEVVNDLGEWLERHL